MSIYRNGSGYYDPTAGEAIKEMEKSMKNRGEYEDGDIVEVIRNSGTQYEMVLLKCHKEYATALMLTESEPAENAVNILSMTPMYTDAGKVQYIYYKNICRFVRATSDSEYEALKEAVRRALNLGGGELPSKGPDEAIKQNEETIKALILEKEAVYEKLIKAEAQLELMKELFRER